MREPKNVEKPPGISEEFWNWMGARGAIESFDLGGTIHIGQGGKRIIGRGPASRLIKELEHIGYKIVRIEQQEEKSNG